MTKQHSVHSSVYRLATAFACSCIWFASPACAETIVIGGTGSALGTMRLLGQAFGAAHPEHTVKVLPSLGTSGGIRALQAGALNMAVTVRDVTAEEKAAGLAAARYGTTVLVFAGNIKTPSLPLNRQKLADIYSGMQTAWPDGQPIRVVLRPKADIDTVLVRRISPEVEAAVDVAHQRPGMILAVTDTESADAIENTPGALGTSTLALLLSEKRKVNVFPFDGIRPSIQALRNGTYPYAMDLYMVTAASPSAGTSRFIEFVRGPSGRRILMKNGHLIE